MPTKGSKAYHLESIERMVDRFWLSCERQSIIYVLSEAGLGDKIRGSHLLSNVKPPLLCALRSMTDPQLQVLNAHLRVSLPPCKRGPRENIEPGKYDTFAKVKRLAESGVSVRKASDIVAYEMLPKTQHEAEYFDAFRKQFLDMKKRIEKFASISITTTGGTTSLTMDQERVMFIDICGTLASDVVINFSGHRGSWILDNRTCGGFAITAKVRGQKDAATAGSAVTVLTCDGVDIYSLPPT